MHQPQVNQVPEKKLIILDRDGVINYESKAYIKNPDEWIPIPQSLEAIALLKKQGYQVAIASNQSGIGRGMFRLDDFEAMNAKMQSLLARHQAQIDAIFFCPHIDADHCHCRKPKPGLLEQIAAHFEVDFKNQQVYFIGDSLRDIQAAHTAGCSPILVRTGNGQETFEALPKNNDGIHVHNGASIPIYDNLHSAVEALLSQ